LHEQYLLAPARYVDLNPVRAKLVKRAEEYPLSSAAAYLNGENDILVNVEPIMRDVLHICTFIKQRAQVFIPDRFRP